MSQSFSVECPNCHARGELADTSLLGQQIACPGCQHVFVIPLPNVATQHALVESVANVSMPPAVETTVASEMPQETAPAFEPDQVVAAPASVPNVPPLFPTGELQPTVTMPLLTPPACETALPDAMPVVSTTPPVSPVPQLHEMSFPGSAAPSFPVAIPHAELGASAPHADFLTPTQLTGPVEEQFAAALPPPSVRGAMKPHQPKSKTLTMLGWGSLAFVILFTSIMFLLGDPFRKPNRNPNASTAKKNAERAAEAAKPQPGDKSLSDVLSKLQEDSKAGSDNPPPDSKGRK